MVSTAAGKGAGRMVIQSTGISRKTAGQAFHCLKEDGIVPFVRKHDGRGTRQGER